MAELTLPPISPNISAATVARWLKKPGETVVAGDVLVELEGEEATVQIEAQNAVRLVEILAAIGRTVRVGDVLARIETSVGSASISNATPTELETSVSKPSEAVSGKVVPILMPQAGNTMEEG